VAPLAAVAANEFAAEPFAPDSLLGAVALVRRGGGLGFAQKALAAREAGAVGCVIYDGEGALDHWTGQMGLECGEKVHPDPGIPALLVDLATGALLREALAAGARVRIGLDHSREALRRLPAELEALTEVAEAGKAVHMAVVVDRAEVESNWLR